jgi:molybdate transport repressor ModE-like protein
MSYRWAWGRLNDAEKALNVALLTHSGHESGGKAKVLTPAAKELLAWYSQVEKELIGILDRADAAQPEFIKGR